MNIPIIILQSKNNRQHNDQKKRYKRTNKGRFIGENTRLLYDLMHYLEQHNKTGLLLLVDFEKAFDSVEWKFLKKALSSFNFGPSVCKWFELFYSKAKSCVINNGHIFFL